MPSIFLKFPFSFIFGVLALLVAFAIFYSSSEQILTLNSPLTAIFVSVLCLNTIAGFRFKNTRVEFEFEIVYCFH